MAARYWLLTIPYDRWDPAQLKEGDGSYVVYCKGQAEKGTSTGYDHWQVFVGFGRPVRLAHIKWFFSRECHAEKSRSVAAEEYVWKEETRVEGTQFEFGKKKVQRSCVKDWDVIKASAMEGNFDTIPADIYVRCYNQLKRIEKDHLVPTAGERMVYCFWGDTGTGKSRRAWDEATFDAYPKTPTSKFWDGYNGQENVVIDEFRGQIEISHMLRWLDRYPVIVENKGGSLVFKAKKIWITSNLNPRDWYPGTDVETVNALLRRMEITHFNKGLTC